jgi:hypothetical protein
MMSSLKTFPSNISSKETEVLNDVHLSTLQPRNPETGPQSHHTGCVLTNERKLFLAL